MNPIKESTFTAEFPFRRERSLIARQPMRRSRVLLQLNTQGQAPWVGYSFERPLEGGAIVVETLADVRAELFPYATTFILADVVIDLRTARPALQTATSPFALFGAMET